MSCCQYDTKADEVNYTAFERSVLYGSDALGDTLTALTVSSGYGNEEPGFFQHGAAHYRLRGSLALRCDHPSEKWWAEARVTAAAKADRLAANDRGDTQRIPPGGTPSYVTASPYAGYQATENLQFNLALENLTDEDFRVHGSGLNESGFGAVLGLRYSW